MKLAAFVFGAVPLVIQLYARKYMEDDKTKTISELRDDYGIPRIKTYDFIIIGAGTAGSLVAGRLSEQFNVLLLEAGGPPVPQSKVPYLRREVTADPDTNYLYKSIPQRNMSLATGGIVRFDMGKMMGGSGSHNSLNHNRGSPYDWDRIAAITGDPSWSYEDMLPLFKRSENFVGQLINPEEADYYGYDGPLTVETHMPTIFRKWSAAGEELGYTVADPNAHQIPSFTPVHKMIDKGGRVSTYISFIKPYEGTRVNLTVIRYSTVSQILLDDNNHAYGVAYLRHGIPQISHASKEVILSAGAINSGILLMMSGIGDQAMLEAAQIPLRVSSPSVGKNLDDHIFLRIPDFSLNAASSFEYLPRIPEAQFESELTKYLETGAGELGEVPVGPQMFYASSRAKAEGEENWADAQMFMSPCPMSMDDEVKSGLCFTVKLGRGKSRGSIGLNSSAYLGGSMDFVELAEIDFNGLSVASDMDVVLEGIDIIFQVVYGTEAFVSMGAEYNGEPITGCVQIPFRSREYWKCYVDMMSTSAHHLVGTCGMGMTPVSVTDSKMRVRGTSGLRVVDASVLPVAPNANINGPVIVVAEKAVDNILGDWM